MVGLAQFCPRCQHTKPLTTDFFYIHRARKGHPKDSWESYCKECWKFINKENKQRINDKKKLEVKEK